MGTYNITVEELQDNFEKFLESFSGEGDVTADCIMESWNNLCDKWSWTDKLRIESQEKACIEIEVEGGCVTEVKNLPDGWVYEIIDHDKKRNEIWIMIFGLKDIDRKR